MKLDEFLAHPFFSKYKTEVEPIREEFIEKGCEKFLWVNYNDLTYSTDYTNSVICTHQEVKIHQNILAFIEKLSHFDTNDYIFIYPEDFSPNFLMAQKISYNAKRSFVIDNIFAEDDTKNWVSIFDSKDIKNAAIMFNIVYYNIPFKGDNYGGYKLFGKGLMYYADCLQYNNKKLKVSGVNLLAHFQGNGIRRDTNPRFILESRRVVEMLLRLKYFNDEYEIFYNMYNSLLPFLHNMYLNAKKLLGDNIIAYRKDLIELKNQMIADGVVARKWKNEQSLFSMVKKEYPDALFQHRPRWLEPQNLDIYIPSLNVGIEYQGIQHYESIDFFGGQEAFLHRQKLDVRKKQLCKINKLNLIEWHYTEDITLKNLNEKIRGLKNDI